MNKTLDYYNKNSEKFIISTMNVDMSNLQDCFLESLSRNFENREKVKILDFGAGSGRDSLYFMDKGFSVTAIDGSTELCRHMRDLGILVKCMDFLDFHEKDTYHGIWACASLLHLDYENLIKVLKNLETALKDKGILYTSFKNGDFEGYRNGRYFLDFEKEKLKALIEKTGFSIEKYFITADRREGREEEKWHNIILMKKG